MILQWLKTPEKCMYDISCNVSNWYISFFKRNLNDLQETIKEETDDMNYEVTHISTLSHMRWPNFLEVPVFRTDKCWFQQNIKRFFSLNEIFAYILTVNFNV